MRGFERVTLSRRGFLTGTAAAAASATVPLPLASAKAPIANVQVPAFYRFKLGAFEATVVSDGPLHLGEPQGSVFSGVSKEDMLKSLTDNFLPVDDVLLEQNALVINTGDRIVLFDTGIGRNQMMGSDAGRLLVNLRAAGIDAKDVDAVVLTHAHPDHCWALMADDGTRTFPNAQLYLAQADFDFWTDVDKLGNAALKSFVEGTRKHLLPNRDRMVFVRDGQEFLPGIQALAAPGHTVGHTVYLVNSQGKSICNVGDIAHHHVLSVENPRREFAYDTDGKQAINSRLRLFDMLSSNRIPLVTYHFPWPGVGHVGKAGDGFRYFPSPMRMAL